MRHERMRHERMRHGQSSYGLSIIIFLARILMIYVFFLIFSCGLYTLLLRWRRRKEL